MEGTLQLDNENVWMSTLNMLEQFIARKDLIENVMQECIEYPLKEGLDLGDGDWEIIQDVVSVLEPFKVRKNY